MTEREMEDLIAAFPSEFFPRRHLVFKARQGSLSGVGRFDLLFEDEFGTNMLMELKARPAKYEDASQLARYKDELHSQGKRIVMWLVAPHIPSSVREFLDHIGIEYDEIHESEFRLVAQRHGITTENPGTEQEPAPTSPQVTRSRRPDALQARSSRVETGPTVIEPSTLRWYARGNDLVLMNRDAFEAGKFGLLIEAFEDAVPSRRNARVVGGLRQWAGNNHSPLPLAECQSLLRWVITSGWRNAVPAADAVWAYLFGRPAPTWQTWNGTRYQFDYTGWKRWYDSLPH